MKSKYKVKRDWGDHKVFNNGKFVCSCDTKHQAYKIKSALEQFCNYQHCDDCTQSNCIDCHVTTHLKSHFQPKEKK